MTEHAPLADPDDAEIERICDEAAEAAVHCIHMAVAVNPYADDPERAEIWSCAFRNAYARENGY